MPTSSKKYRIVRYDLMQGKGSAAILERGKREVLVGTLRIEGKFQGAFGKRALFAALARSGRND